MSETDTVEQEQVPNPYNMKKPWHKGQDKPSPKANELFYQEEEPVSNTQATRQTKTAPEDTSTTNYKKRYDDLKKHYDQKIGEFKQKEMDWAPEALLKG